MTPLPANAALDQFFLDARARVLDLAAILDRLDRGDRQKVTTDPRMQKLLAGLQELLTPDAGRAERVQQIFSLPYDSAWPRPVPRDV